MTETEDMDEAMLSLLVRLTRSDLVLDASWETSDSWLDVVDEVCVELSQAQTLRVVVRVASIIYGAHMNGCPNGPDWDTFMKEIVRFVRHGERNYTDQEFDEIVDRLDI